MSLAVDMRLYYSEGFQFFAEELASYTNAFLLTVCKDRFLAFSATVNS
jgi:hypothetical protein